MVLIGNGDPEPSWLPEALARLADRAKVPVFVATGMGSPGGPALPAGVRPLADLPPGGRDRPGRGHQGRRPRLSGPGPRRGARPEPALGVSLGPFHPRNQTE